jgi:hypothetical protein
VSIKFPLRQKRTPFGLVSPSKIPVIARLTPRDAYRFARDEQVTASSGQPQPAKLGRPLDFLVATDHSDNMGFATDLLAGKSALLADPKGREWYDLIQQGKGGQAALDMIGLFSQGKVGRVL